MNRVSSVAVAVLLAATTSRAAVHKAALYHASTNLDAATEQVPGLAGTTFLEVDYATTSVVFHVLTDSPATDTGESARVRIRIYSNREDLRDATLVTNVVITDTNRFHDTPASGSITVGVWRASWQPTFQFSGTAFYAPQILAVSSNTGATNFLYLIRGTGTNTGPDWGINDSFWLTNAQVHGLSVDFLDYTFAWTNPIPTPFNWIYFNSTNRGLPQNELVPGLGRPFFDYSYQTSQPSYLHVITPSTGIVSVLARFYYLNGPGEVFTNAVALTNVVIASTNAFNGLPASGEETVTVWRASFFQPNNWLSNTVYFAPRVLKAGESNMWCVHSLVGISDGLTASNNFTDAQYFYSAEGGYYGRDWDYVSTGAVARPGLSLDWSYFNHSSLNPLTEPVPLYGGRPFVSVDYGRTVTTFRVMTDLPYTVIPGEDMLVKIRTVYEDPLSPPGTFITEFRDMTTVTTLVLDSSAPFHGLPAAGAHTVQLWSADWPHPNSAGVPLTNQITVYYAPLLQSVAGSLQYVTDERYLVRAIESATNGWGSNNFTSAPQFYGREGAFHDYSYIHKRAGIDGFYFNNTNGPAPEVESVPGLGVPFLQYNYGTNEFSYVHILAPAQGLSSMAVRIYFSGTADEITYNAALLTNVVLAATNPFHGLPASGSITLAVWRAAFLPPTNSAGNTLYVCPRAFLAGGDVYWLVRNLDGASGYPATVNNWPTNAQALFADPSGFFNRDWPYTPTASVQRTGATFDWAYHNRATNDPETQLVPGLATTTFRMVSYATTSTVFHILTDHPFNVVPEEIATARLRVAWSTNLLQFTETVTNMTIVTNLVLDAGLPFLGMPTSGVHTVDLWRATWPHPTTGGLPITIPVYVFYSVQLKTTMGSAAYETDGRHLLARLEGATNGWGENNYTLAPQVFGPNFVNHDYLYTNLFPAADADGDGLADLYEDNTGTFVDPEHTGTNPGDPDSDDDASGDGDEVVAGTDPNSSASYFKIAYGAAMGGQPFIQWAARTNRDYTVEKIDGWATNIGVYSILYSGLSIAADGTLSTNLPAGTGPEIIRLRVRKN